MSFPTLTFPTELPPIVRKELEQLVAQFEGFLRGAGFNADGSFHALTANSLTVTPQPELPDGDGNLTVTGGGSMCVVGGSLCVKTAGGDTVFTVNSTTGSVQTTTGVYEQYIVAYTGTGIERTIGLPFVPDAIWCSSIDASGSPIRAGVIKTQDMSGLSALSLGPSVGIVTDAILSLAAPGVKLGTSTAVNDNTKPYILAAFRDRTGNFFRTGTYVGNAADDRDIEIDAAGWRPTLLWIFGSPAGGAFKQIGMATDYSVDVNANLTTANKIQKFTATGFQLGSASSANANLSTFYWIAWRHDAAGALNALLKLGNFAGTGSAQAVTGVGFTPEMIRCTAPTSFGGGFRHTSHTGSNASRLSDGIVRTTMITALGVDGFTAGTDISQSTKQSWWQAFKTGSVTGLFTLVSATEISGDISVDDDGVATLGVGVVSDTNVAVGAGIQLAKLESIATQRVLGRSTAGTGAIEQLSTLPTTVQDNITRLGTVTSGQFANTALQIRDTDASHNLTIRPGSNLTAARTLTLTTGDAARTITLSGNPTLDDWFDQSVKVAANPTFASVTVGNTGLHVLDTDASHDLIVAPGSNLTADRTLTVTTGDANRTLTISGNATLDDWFDQGVKTTSTPTFAKLGVNTAPTASAILSVGGSFTGAVWSIAYVLTPDLTVPVNGEAYMWSNAGTITSAGSGTHPQFGGAIFRPPSVTSGGASLTNAATLIITDETGATVTGNNYALWVQAGLSQFDGTLVVTNPPQWLTDGTGAGAAALGANSPAGTLTAPYTWLTMLSSDGSTVYVPAWK